MISLLSVEVSGESSIGRFGGKLTFAPGLQVISADNAFGKSLAVKTVAWCLGLEAMFGVSDNDASFFPLAAREEIDLRGQTGLEVLSSRGSIVLSHTDGRVLTISRDIKGNPSVAAVEERDGAGKSRSSRLQARYKSMADEHGGLQRFLFEWLGWPRVEVATFKGTTTDLYLENLAPLFYVEQDEGWTDIQARQVTRYQQQQIGQVAVEYILGATGAIAARLAQQNAIQREAGLRASARTIAERVGAIFARHGWAVDWTAGGSMREILARWSSRSLLDALRRDAGVDLADEVSRLSTSATSLRRSLTNRPIDPMDVSAHANASRRVIDLKTRRHELDEELHTLRAQEEEITSLFASLEQRLHAAEDVLRLKTAGVGRLEHIECPTCHRDLDVTTFLLTDQSVDTVGAHVEALKRDRDLVRKNVQALRIRLAGVVAESSRVASDFRDAERALLTVTEAVGTVREQLAQTAANLSATERQLERLKDTTEEIRQTQEIVDNWLDSARQIQKEILPDRDLAGRVRVFTNALREYLIALGHSSVRPDNVSEIRLDDQYVPFLGNRRLRSLGSASDKSRVVAAFSLALAAASMEIQGFHPGFVLLDEPFQQNPDVKHRDLFSNFLSSNLTGFQVIVVTFLQPNEVAELSKRGVPVQLFPTGTHFLSLVAPTPDGSQTGNSEPEPGKAELPSSDLPNLGDNKNG